jgi:hypothetical protein
MARLPQQPAFEESSGRLRKKIYKIPQQPRKTILFPAEMHLDRSLLYYYGF